MKYRVLKRAGISLSEIGFGCMSLEPIQKQTTHLLRTAFEGGINYFDTADIYQSGYNEEMVGEALQPFREKIILATKVGNQPKEAGSGWIWNPSKNYILQAVERSLKRLRTDYIDIYQLHGGTLDDNREEVIETFELLKDQGKILHYGISSIRPNVINEYVKKSGIVTNMMQYSLLDRRPEEQVLKWLVENDIGLLVRGALARGFLLNKDLSDYLDYSIQSIDLLKDKIDSFSNEKISPFQLIIQWVLHHPAVTSVVLGIRTAQQLEEALAYNQCLVESENIFSELSSVLPVNYYQEHRV